MAASLVSEKSMQLAKALLAAAIEAAKTAVSLPGKAFFWRPFLVVSSRAPLPDAEPPTDDASASSSIFVATGASMDIAADE